jgi:hypothetical protein
MATICIILSIVVSRNWCLRQLDVQNAFLHSVLEEDVYMKQLPRYVDPSKPMHVCKLDKVLYRLKQAPRAWCRWLSAKLVQLGFVISRADTSLFVYNKSGLIIYLLVYVDVIIVTNWSTSAISALLQDLQEDFTLKNLGDLHFFLGIQVTRLDDGLLLLQGKYASELLQRADMQKCKSVKTPLATSDKLSSSQVSGYVTKMPPNTEGLWVVLSI